MIDFGFEIKVLTGSSLKNIQSINKAVSNLKSQLVDFKKTAEALDLFRKNKGSFYIKNEENQKLRSEQKITELIARQEEIRKTHAFKRISDVEREEKRSINRINQINESKQAKIDVINARKNASSQLMMQRHLIGSGGRGFGSGFGLGSLVSMGLPIAGGLSLYGAGRSLIGTGTYLENTKMEMDALMGNKELSADMRQNLIDFAAKSPMSMKESMKYGRMLIGGGVKNEDVIKTLKMLGDVSFGSGGDLSAVMFNYLQGLNKKNIDTVDIKQYGNQLIPMMKTLEFMFKDTKAFKNLGGIQPMIEAGLIGKSAIDEAFKLMTGKNGMYKDFMEKWMQTTQGKWEIMVQKMQIASVKLFDYMKPAINSIIDSVTKLADRFDELYPSIIKLANPFIMVWDAGKGIAKTFGLISDNSNDLTGNLKSLLQVLEKILYVAVAIKGISLLAGGVTAIAKLGALVSGIGAGGILMRGIGLGAFATAGATAAGASTTGGVAALTVANIGTGLAVLVPLAVTAVAAYMGYKQVTDVFKKDFERKKAYQNPSDYYFLGGYKADGSGNISFRSPQKLPYQTLLEKRPNYNNLSYAPNLFGGHPLVVGTRKDAEISENLKEKPKSAEDLINEQLAKLGKELNALRNGGGGVDSGGKFTKIEIQQVVGAIVNGLTIQSLVENTDFSKNLIDKYGQDIANLVINELVSVLAIQGNRQ